MTERAEFAAGRNVLIVGARRGSLGEQIAFALGDMGASVTTAGLTDVDEDLGLDITDTARFEWCLRASEADHVIVTAGVNEAAPFDSTVPDFGDVAMDAFMVNALAPLRALAAFRRVAPNGGHFVVISSNSAHIARTMSAAYCMSKAALSMGIRCAAREIAKEGRADGRSQPIAYGWEFGLLKGTPMTQATAGSVQGPLTRMPGLPNGIAPYAAAQHVSAAVRFGWRELNGCMFRLDAGEQ